MLIDWITARLPLTFFSPEQLQELQTQSDRVRRFDPKTGEVRYEMQAWDSVRSDSHQVVFRVGSSDLWLQGSPARVCGDGCAVFGSGPSREMDITASLSRMIDLLFSVIGNELKPAKAHLFDWIVSRADITRNFVLGSMGEVLSGLRILRDCEGGRYRVLDKAGDTVYWGGRSKRKRGKAYAKGPHLRYQMKSKEYKGRIYTETEMQAAEKLIRLELTLGREWFRELPNSWHSLTRSDFIKEWEAYFSRMLGDAEMKTDNQLLEKVLAIAPTPGQGKSAYAMWLLIKAEGWERAKQVTTKSLWFRNLKILHQAGLGDADISTGKIVELRRRVLELREVSSWQELLAA